MKTANYLFLITLLLLTGCSDNDEIDTSNPYPLRDDLVSKMTETSLHVTDGGDTIENRILEYNFSYSFDSNGRVIGIKERNLSGVSIEYDSQGRLLKMFNGDNSSKELVYEFRYSGNIANIYDHRFGNGIHVSRIEFDNNLQPILFSWVNSAQSDTLIPYVWENENLIKINGNLDKYGNWEETHLIYSNINSNILMEIHLFVQLNKFHPQGFIDWTYPLLTSKNACEKRISLRGKFSDTLSTIEYSCSIIPNEKNYPKVITASNRYYPDDIYGDTTYKDSATFLGIQTFEYY